MDHNLPRFGAGGGTRGSQNRTQTEIAAHETRVTADGHVKPCA